jgi:large subunit ribosomal protein L49
MSLPFLRPLALPRPSTLTHFLGIARVSTTTASSATLTSVPAKPYRVDRSGTNNLPVYLLSKRGGNLKQTKVRRIEGNINVLRADLQQALGVDEKDVTINQLTQHIIIKVGS